MNEIKKNSAIVFFIKVVSSGLALLVNAFITNNLSNESAGKYYFMMSVVLFLNPLAIWGFNNFVLKKMAILSDSDSDSDDSINGMLLKSVQSSVFINIIIVTSFLLFYNEINGMIFHNSVTFVTYACLIFSIPFFSLGTIITHALQGCGKIKSAMIISGPAIQIFIFIPAFIINADNSDMMASCYLVSCIIFFILSLSVWLKGNGFGYKNTLDSKLTLIKDNTHLMAIQFLGVIYLSLSQLLLGLTGNIYDVAKLAICIKVSTLLSFILQAVNKVVAPKFSSLYHKKEMEELRTLVKSSTRILLIACTPIVIFILLFSESILSLFGEGYIDAAWILRVLIISQMVNICTGTVSYLLMMTGHEKSHRNNIMISSLLSLVIGIVFIEYMGIYGAVIMISFALICTNMLSWLMVKRKLGINTLNIF